MDGKNFDELTRKLASGTSRRNVLRGLIGGGAALVGMKATGTLAQKQTKVALCHRTASDSNPYVQITVANSSADLAPHLTHGDFYFNAGTECCGPKDCPGTDQCNIQACDISGAGSTRTSTCGAITPREDGTACNDGNACTQTDTCQAGSCVGSNPVICTAIDACHVAGICDTATGICTNPNAPDGTGCNDGNACTQTDTCQAGACVGSNSVVCMAIDDCHVAGVCDTATGICSNPNAPDGTGCNDGNACTQTDTCQAGACVGSNSVICTASDQCHVAGVCDPATGTCSNPNAADGTSCNDGNACTQTDTCQAGSCVGGNSVVCTALDQCHVAGVCDSATGVCSNPIAAVGTICGDCLLCAADGSCTVEDPDCGKACTSDAQCNPQQCCCAVKGQPEGTCVAESGCLNQGSSEHVCLA